ncbi:hypothetical protein PYR74_00175 (plasmid) [Acinetobacter bereziniae]|nr:hypothetical protein [Acinetobacter soli]WEH96194.1 hypothetical protein PYR90_16785 [Acinetobacter johnsonii]WEI20882.1 hypothetical protein PYR74_00175 [Acinetobacter bereziniae]WEI11081.1 hypothetical protein PYR73_17425 [Acinetobacter soli]WEI11602.1 hypothetical protein PX667_01350 [Acinetobacter soli]WEI16822.1 hypothetical protein PX668_17005 [Acinetobacter soli]
MKSLLDFFTNRSKTLNIIVNPELNTGHSLADFSYNEELHQDLNVLTVIPLDHYGNFLSLTLDDWGVITSKVQFPEHLDFNQLLSIFWETQPILVVTDIARSEVHDSDFFNKAWSSKSILHIAEILPVNMHQKMFTTSLNLLI